MCSEKVACEALLPFLHSATETLVHFTETSTGYLTLAISQMPSLQQYIIPISNLTTLWLLKLFKEYLNMLINYE